MKNAGFRWVLVIASCLVLVFIVARRFQGVQDRALLPPHVAPAPASVAIAIEQVPVPSVRQESRTIRVRILDAESRRALEDAKVSVSINGVGALELQTGDPFRFECPPAGLVSVCFQGSPTHRRVERTFDAADAAAVAQDTIDLLAEERHILCGTCTDVAGTSLQGRNVVIVLGFGTSGGTEFASQFAHRPGSLDGADEWHSVTAAPDGSYSIEVPSPGIYGLVAGGEGWALVDEEVAVDIRGTVQRDLPFTRLACAVIHVVDSERGGHVTGPKSLAPLLSKGLGTAVSFPKSAGRYDYRCASALLAGIDPDLMEICGPFDAVATFTFNGLQCPISELDVSVAAPGYSSVNVQVPVRALSEGLSPSTVYMKPLTRGLGTLVLQFSPAAAGRLEQPTVIVPGCIARLVPVSYDGPSFALRLDASSGGEFTLTGIPIGRYRLSLDGPDHRRLDVRRSDSIDAEQVRSIEVDVSRDESTRVELDWLDFALVEALIETEDGGLWEGRVDMFFYCNSNGATQVVRQISFQGAPYRVVFSKSGPVSLAANLPGARYGSMDNSVQLDAVVGETVQVRIKASK